MPLQRYIEARAVEDDKLNKGGCWSALQHSAGRLLSYQYAAETLVKAHHLWKTELFSEFDIKSLRSSASYPKDAMSMVSEPAEAIINRAPGANPAQIQAYKQHAAELQRYGVEIMLEELREKARTGQGPIVHAEMLLHDWLARTPGGTQPYRFFSHWRYIGTSKPLCRLCQDYFHVIATPVRFRSGHPNTYLNWRLPDIYVDNVNDEAGTEAARTAWCEVLGQMKGQVYAGVVRVLVEKVSDKKLNDSNTYTDRITAVGDRLANWLTLGK